MKKYRVAVIIITLVAVTLSQSCTEYDSEPPKTEQTSSYLIPSTETPTDEENEIAKQIRLEYEEHIPKN